MSPDGVAPDELLRVERLGPTNSDAAPLVLVHGFAACNHFWRHWAPELARDRRVHLVELTGFGAAPAPRNGDYSPPAHARRLAAWLAQEPGPAPILVGHSLGGAVIMLAALQRLDAGRPVAGLAVVSGAVYEQSLPPWISAVRIPFLGELLLLPLAPPEWALRLGIRGIVHDPDSVKPDTARGYREPLRSRDHRRAVLSAARQIDPSVAGRFAARYPELAVPTLALWGEEDRVVPPEFANRLAREMPDARAVVLDSVGHLPPEEAPERSLAELRRFMDRID